MSFSNVWAGRNVGQVMHLTKIILWLCGVGLVVIVEAGCQGCTPLPADASQSTDFGAPPSVRSRADGDRVVTLTEAEAAVLHIVTYTAQRHPLYRLVKAPGEAVPSPAHYAVVSAPIAGRIVHITAHEGESVRAGQVLLELDSIEYAEMVADYLRATAALRLAHARVQRTGLLARERIAASSALEAEEAGQATALADWNAARARLLVTGLPPDQIDRWAQDSIRHARLPVMAPLSGRIEKHDIALGQAVEAYETMLTIVDPRVVFVRAYLPPDDAEDLRVGTPVVVTRPGSAGSRSRGEIVSVNPTLDDVNRSVVVNARVRPQNDGPRPGEPVEMMAEVTTSSPGIAVPVEALFYDGDRPAVFVKVGDAQYEQRLVETGIMMDDEVEVVAGIEEGEQIVVSQVFALKAKTRFQLYGEE